MKAWVAKSFRNRIFITVLSATLLPLLLCNVLMTVVMVSRSEQSLQAEARADIAIMCAALDAQFDAHAELVDALATSTVTRSALRSERESRPLYQLLYRRTIELRDYASFDIYDDSGVCCYTTDTGAHILPRSTDWGALHAAANSESIVFRADTNGGMIAARSVRSYDGTVLGYVTARMDDAGFAALLAPLLGSADNVLLADPTWRAVYSTQEVRSNETLSALRAQLLAGETLTGGKEECDYYVEKSMATGFFLILQQPRTYTAQVVNSIYFTAATMGILCLLLCLVCAWVLSHHLSGPVNELDAAMRRVKDGDYDVRLESDRTDEMGRLTASFNRMTREYRQNLERSVQHERELNETRLRMLQSQLNPHFLYNTLDAMKWLGVANHVPQVAELSTNLASLLRAGISGNDRITLEEELELITQYLTIQEIRFEDRFVCEIDVDERFQHCMLPKLLLQPLVENAVIHGVADCEEGYIKLWAEQDGEDLLLKVSDNGKGMPEDIARRLNEHEVIPGGHLGLNNVDRIVRLYYGERYGLHVTAAEGGGCCVELRLPLQKGEGYA